MKEPARSPRPQGLVIAIDGPSGAGKSTAGRALAARLGYVFIDTGAMYRAFALKAVRRGIPLDDELALGRLAEDTRIELVEGGRQVLLDGEEVTAEIRTPEVSAAASRASRHPAVRRVMVARQRELGREGGVVLDGRDIGTAVFPDADVKFYFDADPTRRARRRHGELREAGAEAELAAVERDTRERDRADSTRTDSPLSRAADAVLLDTTTLTPEEVVDRMLQVVRPGGPEATAARVRLLSAIFILLGILLRVVGARGDLWLDEIWSLKMVWAISSPVEILTRLTHDNNHPLNSFYLWLMGPDASGFAYRLFSVVTGALALLVTAAFVRQRPPFEAVASIALMALSFPLVLYGSEARGYGPAIFCALAALLLLDLPERRGGLLLFWVTLVAGLLSHLSFALVAVALGLLVAERRRRGGASVKAVVGGLVRWFLAPVVLSLALYAPYLRGLGFGGAPPEPVSAALLRWMGLVGGVPPDGPAGTLLSLAVVLLLLWGIGCEWREGASEWALFAAVLFLPVLAVAILRPKFLVARYMVVTVPYLVLLLARTLAGMAAGRRGRYLAGLLLAAVLAGSAYQVFVFLRVGRGHYQEAVLYMLRSTEGQDVTVTSDHDFRNRMLLSFYVPRAGLAKRVIYVPLASLPPEGTDWLIHHSLRKEARPPLETREGGHAYRFAYHAPFFGELSGFHWFLYRRDDAGAPRR